MFYFQPYLGKWSNYNLTNIFQLGWNHQLVIHSHVFHCRVSFPGVHGRKDILNVEMELFPWANLCDEPLPSRVRLWAIKDGMWPKLRRITNQKKKLCPWKFGGVFPPCFILCFLGLGFNRDRDSWHIWHQAIQKCRKFLFPLKKSAVVGLGKKWPSKQKETGKMIGRISKRVTNIKYSFTPELFRNSKPCWSATTYHSNFKF